MKFLYCLLGLCMVAYVSASGLIAPQGLKATWSPYGLNYASGSLGWKQGLGAWNYAGGPGWKGLYDSTYAPLYGGYEHGLERHGGLYGLDTGYVPALGLSHTGSWDPWC